MPGKKKIAVLGAGISGLAAIKSCLEENLEPTCFEQYDNIGGVWYYTKEYREGQGASVFDSVVSNNSKELLAYSDFPYPSHLAPYLLHTDVHDYLKSYSKHFGLDKYINLNTKVTKVRRSRDYDVTGTWEVETVSNGSTKRQEFDCVMVCSGFFKKPHPRRVDGMETFKGNIQHSATYRNGEQYKNKRVLVVGNGNSSGDLAAGAACYAERVFYSVGPGFWIIPRFLENGIPYDYILLRRHYTLKEFDKILYDMMASRLDVQHSGSCPPLPPTMSRILVNDEVQNYIMNGKIQIHGRLVRLGPREAEFDDGSVVHDLDAVLFATGYEFSLDFLEEKIMAEDGKLSLYKMVFPLHLPHQTLALVGCQDLLGPNSPAAELQARLASRVFSGAHKLPQEQKMIQEVEQRNKMVYGLYGRYKYTFQYLPFRDEIAEELGVIPSWFDLIKAGPWLAYNYLRGPIFPYQDRIWGPHPWSGARKAIQDALDHGYYAKQPRHSNPPKPGSDSKLTKLLFVVSLSAVTMFTVKYFRKWNFVA